MTATARQIGAIHALKTRVGLDDASYRDVLEAETGKRSSKGLSVSEAGRVMDRLKLLSGGSSTPLKEGAERLSGKYVGVCRALWLTGWNLGVFDDRRDSAMIAFTKRQTGLDHVNWLRDDAQAAQVIEALKGWLTRETGFDWSAGSQTLQARNISLTRWRKEEVLRRQIERLEDAGIHDVPALSWIRRALDADLDRKQTDLGELLRRALKGK